MNPWALIWANDRYYLYGYDVKGKEEIFRERNYRVDKLADIELSETPRNGEKQVRNFDANTYVSRRIGMFAGNEQMITVKIPENLAGAFIDQFGKNILISEDEDNNSSAFPNETGRRCFSTCYICYGEKPSSRVCQASAERPLLRRRE